MDGSVNAAFGTPDRPARLYLRTADALRRALADGKYSIGRRLPSERELCLELGVNRSTLREALACLAAEGLIEVRRNSGAYVRRLPNLALSNAEASDALNLLEATELLLGPIFALAASRITDSEIEQVSEQARSLMEARKLHYLAATANLEFHLLIGRATRNRELEATVRSLISRGSETRGAQILRADASGSDALLDYYQAVVDALRARSPRAAHETVVRHCSMLRDYILRRPQ